MTPSHKRIFSAIAGTIFCLTAWSQQPPKPETPAQIGTWVVEDVWNKGDFRMARQLSQPTIVLHFPLTPESATQTVHSPTFTSKLDDLIVEGNKVVMRIPFTGTHMGKFRGPEPTGKKIDVTETLILRIKDGRIAEMWEDYDEYGMRESNSVW